MRKYPSSYPSSYVHRGDTARRLRRIKRVALVLGFGATTFVVIRNRPQVEAASAEATHEVDLFSSSRELRAKLDSTRGELDLAKAELERSRRIITYSSKY